MSVHLTKIRLQKTSQAKCLLHFLECRDYSVKGGMGSIVIKYIQKQVYF